MVEDKSRSSWPYIRARFLFREVVERNHDLPLASVTKAGGVEFRDDLDTSVWNPTDDVSSYKRVLPGDFVMGLRSFQSGIGFSNIAGLVSPAYTVLRPIKSIEYRYYKHLFKSDTLISQLENVAQGIRQGRTISTESFYNLRLPVPPAHEQRSIADYLDAETARIDALIEKKRRMIKLLGERDLRMVDECFAPRAGETLVRLSRIANVRTGITLHEGREFDDDTVSHPYLRVANVQPGWLDLSDVKSVTVPKAMADRSRLRAGDVLMTEGGDIDKLGRGTVWHEEIPNCLHQNHVFAVRPDAEVLDSEYLGYLTRTSHARAYFEMTGSQSTNLASTSASKVSDFRIPALPIDEQRNRVEQYQKFASRNQQTVGALTKQIELLTEHRQALITAAVTGE